MFKHSLCIGKIWHNRYSPKIHKFSYKLNSWMIDLQLIKNTDKKRSIFGNRILQIYRFNPQNYLRDFKGDLINKVKNQFSQLGVTLNGDEKFYLWCQVSNLGIYFSPLNLYFCYCDDRCSYVMAEVSNTPWNERHYYMLDIQNPPIITNKQFHVSPFFGLNQEYRWEFDFNQEEISFAIKSFEGAKLVFSAGYQAKLIDILNIKVKKNILTSPITVYKIIIAIYFEALRLWLKRIAFVPHPKNI